MDQLKADFCLRVATLYRSRSSIPVFADGNWQQGFERAEKISKVTSLIITAGKYVHIQAKCRGTTVDVSDQNYLHLFTKDHQIFRVEVNLNDSDERQDRCRYEDILRHLQPFMNVYELYVKLQGFGSRAIFSYLSPILNQLPKGSYRSMTMDYCGLPASCFMRHVYNNSQLFYLNLDSGWPASFIQSTEIAIRTHPLRHIYLAGSSELAIGIETFTNLMIRLSDDEDERPYRCSLFCSGSHSSLKHLFTQYQRKVSKKSMVSHKKISWRMKGDKIVECYI
ncbi:hypothetical protein L596_000252 [Steinernema carpocapsae]|uniref:Uncharacterized protein n=1 Tax=Steinernema carpocapsae TaxID=34508 RepID=A0A4V6I715_STECR|nr:hypothetical protein L596_000252 [Steinernema carpocapsae]